MGARPSLNPPLLYTVIEDEVVIKETHERRTEKEQKHLAVEKS